MVVDDLTGDEVKLRELPGWHHLQLRTAPWKGEWRAQEDAWSNVVDIEVRDDRLGRPVVHGVADHTGTATVSWAAVDGATSYTVQWRRSGAGGWLSTVAAAPSVVVGGLTARQDYAFRVRAEREGLTGDFSAETTVVVPPVQAVRRARVELLRSGALKTTGSSVVDATGYTLRVAPAATCARTPKARRFEVTATGLNRPAKRFRVDAGAVWVRWVAVRDGVEGELGPSSTDCVRLPG
jgi:hypothetical protein